MKELEFVENVEIAEIVNVYAVVVHVAENMAGWRKQLGEYPSTLPPRSRWMLHISLRRFSFPRKNCLRPFAAHERHQRDAVRGSG